MIKLQIFFFVLVINNLFTFVIYEKNIPYVNVKIVINCDTISNRLHETNNPFLKNFIEACKINIVLSAGTVQRIFYLNYPPLFSQNNTSQPNIAGFIVLNGNGLPHAYLTTQNNGNGWQIASSDLIPTRISLLDSNIYVGRNSGPSKNVGSKINSNSNTVFGNNSYIFEDLNYMSFNTVFGANNNDRLIGSYNTIIGSNNCAIKNIIDSNESSNALYNDIANLNDYYNYNIIIGHKMFGIDTNFNIPRASNKQNIMIGNLSAQGVLGSSRNIVMGNNILVSVAGTQIPFYNFTNNIIIGNDILVDQDRSQQKNFNNNIFIIPQGNNSASNISTSNSGSIFIGTSGNKTQGKNRSNQTYIGNIYGDLILNVNDANVMLDRNLTDIFGSSLPNLVWIDSENRLGNFVFPTDKNIERIGFIKTSSGNQLIDDIVKNELMNIPISALQDPQEKVVLFGINPSELWPLQLPKLKSFLIFKDNEELIGYEHMHLVPLLIRALQLQNNKFLKIKSSFLDLATQIQTSNAINPTLFANVLTEISNYL